MDDLRRMHLNAVEFDLARGVQQVEVSDSRTLTAFHASDTHTHTRTHDSRYSWYSNVTLVTLNITKKFTPVLKLLIMQ